ncbi:MAG: HDOD domain-containing protein [Spirochaetaceae bacterium]|jgi:HD-like signal output (HDOD) protein|nr:HDOD domain-containing protein [Spirochaetaceae bacterium]
MNIEPELRVDEDKIKKATQSEIPLTITSYTLPHSMEIYIAQVLAVFLRYAGLETFKDCIEYCVQELAVNAKKANTKRVYFLEKKLDLNDSRQYELGMRTFKKDMLDNLAYYLQMQKDLAYYIKVIFLYKQDSIIIEVRNNVVVSKIEQERIYDKLAHSRQYNSLSDAFTYVLDDSEGAGLGLIVLVLMLKKMGLNEDSFEIFSTDKETIARLTIPFKQKDMGDLSDLTQAIVDNVDSLPHFPENIITIQRLVDSPRSNMIDIAKNISTDPAMTAAVLKSANSPLYMTPKKVEKIVDALKILGMREIKNMLYSYGTQNILGNDTKEKKELWEHSYKTAFFAYNIVRNFGKQKSILDDSYTCAMLHDMGRIVFSKNVPELAAKMASFCERKNIPQVMFEDFAAGMNHAEIGALVAEKWNFPDMFVAAIRYHHDPLSAPQEFRPLVNAVYLANMLCEIESGDSIFEQLEPAVLADFGLGPKKQLELVISRLSQGYLAETKNKTKTA